MLVVLLNKHNKKLVERGEKLSQLADKTSEMQNNALDFLKMTQQLKQREENKKWYEL